VGRGGDGIERGDRAKAPEARTGGGSDDLGEGMGQGGQKGELAKADATARVRGSAPPMGRGTHVLVALPEQADEPMDYERLCASAEAFVYVSMVRLMVRRLARA
jgi:hypothetical protein